MMGNYYVETRTSFRRLDQLDIHAESLIYKKYWIHGTQTDKYDPIIHIHIVLPTKLLNIRCIFILSL